jgi:hypothetical protein
MKKSGNDEKKSWNRVVSISCFMGLILCLGHIDAAAQTVESIPENLKPAMNELIQHHLTPAEVTMLTHQLLHAGADHGTVLNIYHRMKSAIDMELPTEPILNKAFEGLAKRIDPPQIAAALEKVLVRYENAYRLTEQTLHVQKAERTKLGNLAAESMTAGLSFDTIRDILNVIESEATHLNRTAIHELAYETLISARDMARLGTSAPSVGGVLTQALKSGANRDDIRQMHMQFMQLSQRNRPDKLAASLIEGFQNHRRGEPMNISGMIQGSGMEAGKKSESQKGEGGPAGGDSGSGSSGGGSGVSGGGDSGSSGGGASGGEGGSGNGTGGSGGSGSSGGSGASGGSGGGASGGGGGSGSGSGGAGGGGSAGGGGQK